MKKFVELIVIGSKYNGSFFFFFLVQKNAKYVNLGANPNNFILIQILIDQMQWLKLTNSFVACNFLTLEDKGIMSLTTLLDMLLY